MAMTAVFTTLDGQMYHENRGGTETLYIPDPLGNLIACKNTGGTTTYTAEYWPYGEVRTETGTNPSKWGFVGLLGYLKDFASLLYVRARFYKPNLGRWATVDPLWPHESAYGYANDNPCFAVDPSGMACQGPCVKLNEVHGTAIGGCIAVLCGINTAKKLLDWLKKLLKLIDLDFLKCFSKEDAKEIGKIVRDLIKQGTKPLGMEECCTQAANPKKPSLPWLFTKICKCLGDINWTPGSCAKNTTNLEDCLKCCNALYEGTDPQSNGLCMRKCNQKDFGG